MAFLSAMMAMSSLRLATSSRALLYNSMDFACPLDLTKFLTQIDQINRFKMLHFSLISNIKPPKNIIPSICIDYHYCNTFRIKISGFSQFSFIVSLFVTFSQ